ncbi:ranBP-type and C3HC4-type zinc finger-containing protein 1-like isoform X2 [Liolophura sinensis]
MENGTLSPADILNNLSELAKSLETGDVEEAKCRAATLARQKVKVHFEVVHPAADVEKEFSVKVCVEDRDSSGGSISLMVRQSDTVANLKKRIEREYGFPQAIQKWIIGQRIPRDEDVLKNCGVKSPGCTLFLYLVSSRSVGLTKEAFMQAQAASGDVPTLDSEDDQNGYMSMDHFMRGIGAGAGSIPGGPVPLQHTRPRPRPRQPSTGISQRAKAPPLPTSPPPPLRIPQGAVGFSDPPNRPADVVSAESAQMAPRQTAVEVMLGQPSAVQGRSTALGSSTETEGWICPVCTFINLPTRPGCAMCSESRPVNYEVPKNFHVPEEEEARLQRERQLDLQAQDAQRNQEFIQQESSIRNYQELLAADDQDFIPNPEQFDCPICFDVIPAGDGVVLRECLHSFCRSCLAAAVQFTDEAALKCPYQDDNYSCPALLQQREIRALVEPTVFERFLQRGLQTAESQAVNSYHCKTTDCTGWCIYEDLVNFFDCPVCGKQNCLTCKAIHEGMNCKQYQTDLRIRAENDVAAQQTHLVLQNLLVGGEAMHCPTCQVIVQKKEGCDWICCSICKTEICWVTKGPRWGPNGEGDTSGGCRCKVNNQKCHPDCTNCH